MATIYQMWRINADGTIHNETVPNTVSVEDITAGGAQTDTNLLNLGNIDNDRFHQDGNNINYVGLAKVGPTTVGFVAQSGANQFVFADPAHPPPKNVTIDISYNQSDDTTHWIISDYSPACFLAGTEVSTPNGQVAVEALSVGDPVLTADGRIVPVKWVGRQTVVPQFIPEGRRPVGIAAGALAANLPSRELRLTADHALLIDDVLAQAGALVNGSTIRRIPSVELGIRFMVFNIETENHEVILAEGTPAETFVDNVSRRRFDNYAEYEALYGAESGTMEELPYPRAMSAR